MTLRFVLIAALTLTANAAYAQSAEDELLYFTAREMETAYRYQEKLGARLKKPLKGFDCLVGRESFRASQNGREFFAPCRFITETIRHLKQILEAGAAKYLFPLDLDHAHFLIPRHLWDHKYSPMKHADILPALLRDPELIALYHASEHLTDVDPRSGAVDPESRARKEKRNILGFYDGRPNEILPPQPNGSGAEPPKNYYSFGGFHFLASQHGEFFVSLQSRPISIDLTFDLGTDDDLANGESPNPSCNLQSASNSGARTPDLQRMAK
jgi:hypothetical protein